MTTYSNGIHFLEAGISNLYAARRDVMLRRLGEYALSPEQHAQSIENLKLDLKTLAKAKYQAKTIVNLLSRAQFPHEHEDDTTVRVMAWLTENMPDGGFNDYKPFDFEILGKLDEGRDK